MRAALAEPVLHHRTAAFEAIFADIQQGLRWIFQSEHEVLCLSGTGTAAMEGAVCNFLCRGDTALYIQAGKFGERWGEILRAYGVHAVEIPVPWGSAVDVAQVADALAQHPQARAVCRRAKRRRGWCTRWPTLLRLCAARSETLCVVDGITAVGVLDIGLNSDGIDVLLSGSQKAFMLPPGWLLWRSAAAWEQAKRADLPRYYL